MILPVSALIKSISNLKDIMLLATKRDKPMGLYSLAAVAGHNAKKVT